MPHASPTPRKAKTTAAPSAAPTLNARKQQLVRDAIWDAAIDLFAEKGFDETTVEDIAQAAGTSRRSFFRYFASKSDLMAQPVVSYGDVLAEAIRSSPPELSPAEIVRHVVLQVAQFSAVHPRARKVLAISAKYPAAREAQYAQVAAIQETVEQAFAQRCRRSGKDGRMVRLLASLTVSILNVTFLDWFENDRKKIVATAEQVFVTLADLVQGISSPAGKQAPAAMPARRGGRKS